ncbi:MAG TPA: acyl-CoA dehydrogenase family protein, partial [Steroidobacteraceae bacterium]|nr:acyl-CoA dehydrogenase family protein [Steroidobacteraceae bacterium]
MSAPAPFVQPPPRPRDAWAGDWLLHSFLTRRLPPEVLREIEADVAGLAALACGQLWDFQLADRLNEPVLTHWDAWGNRIDRIEVTPLWREAERLTVRYGLVATPYERRHGAWSRTHQFALVYLFHPFTDVYTCPLAMTDGAARTLIASGNQALIARAVPHLTSRDPAQFWTSGQWMTESTGGSDVGLSRTVARPDGGGGWRLYGKKWFTSAATSQMTLTLARPEGNGPGGSGLALFYLETRDSAGALNGIRIERLKDKLGTRKVPTAELTLDGAAAQLVAGRANGTRNIEPMLRITRAWNSVCAISYMRHGLLLAQDYAARRLAFGAPLAEQPLHRETLADLDAESAGAFLLTFELIELLGRDEAGELDDRGRALLRLLTPLAKAVTGKQTVAALSEVIEAFGGAGYVEDTGIPTLLRDAQVLPIWEGTTNVLSLDLLLRADVQAGLAALTERITNISQIVDNTEHAKTVARARAAFDAAVAWHAQTKDPEALQAGARRFALAIGRAFT